MISALCVLLKWSQTELIVGPHLQSLIGSRSAPGSANLFGAGIVEEKKADNSVSGLEFRYKHLYPVAILVVVAGSLVKVGFTSGVKEVLWVTWLTSSHFLYFSSSNILFN